MSETSKKLSKNAKRREKAREKKLTQLVEERKKEEETTVKADPTIAIKQQLAEAKANGDHKLASKLRQDLWVLQDASTGHSIQLESVEIQESMERIEGIKKPNNVVNRNQPSQVQDIINDKSPTEKEIKKVKKKLDQIEKLKQKQANGETLEICQTEKILKEEEYKKELQRLQTEL